jgi:hypothetical protein
MHQLLNNTTENLSHSGGKSVPQKTVLELPPAEQEWIIKELRQARYGYLLG